MEDASLVVAGIISLKLLASSLLFLEERAQSAIGTVNLSPDNLVDNMIANEIVWTSISKLVSSIIKELCRRERLRNATAN
ncbi:hypothetical protein ACLKA7_001687 [Drosophila subpalustris]